MDNDRVAALVAEATNPKTFSVLDTIQKRTYPTDDITIYTDAESTYKAQHLTKKAATEADGEKAQAIHDEIDGLVEKIRASALTFTLRGFAPEVTIAIDEKVEASEDIPADKRDLWRNFNSLAEMIVKVVNAAGEEDEHRWTADEVATLRGSLPSEEFARLFDKMVEVGFATLAFDATVSADFS